MSRLDELDRNLEQVRARIEAACAAAGRPAADVTLVAVTKTHPLADIEALASLGVRHFAENRDREAREKAESVTGDVVWHFVGQVQTNKARSVASYADVVEGVDRGRLVDALSAGAVQAGRTLQVAVQVALDDAQGRGGVALDEGHRSLLELCSAVERAPALVLRGLMGVAPRGADPVPAFVLLARAAAAVQAEHPSATMVSAGMSGDLEAAIKSGSTHVRVGTALLGVRFAPVI